MKTSILDTPQFESTHDEIRTQNPLISRGENNRFDHTSKYRP